MDVDERLPSRWILPCASASEGSEQAVSELELLLGRKRAVAEYSLMEFAWRAASATPMRDGEVVEQQ